MGNYTGLNKVDSLLKTGSYKLTGITESNSDPGDPNNESGFHMIDVITENKKVHQEGRFWIHIELVCYFSSAIYLILVVFTKFVIQTVNYTLIIKPLQTR